MKSSIKDDLLSIFILIMAIVFLFAPFWFNGVLPENAPQIIPPTPKVLKCIDGDTFALDNTYYRLSFIDTPEKGEIGYKASSVYTCDYLNAHLSNLNLTTHGLDKYQRTLVEVGTLNEDLIANCLAEPFYGKSTPSIINLYNTNCK